MLDRWTKMYRKLYIKFFHKEMVHTEDIKQMLEMLNQRITLLENNVTKELTGIQTAINTHTHPVSTSGGPGTASAGPPTYQSAFANTQPVQFIDAQTVARYSELLGYGPGAITLASGADPDTAVANAQFTADVLNGG